MNMTQQEWHVLPAWLTTDELAELLRKPKSWVFNNAGPLGIPRVKLGKHYRYPRAGVEAWLAEQSVSA